MALSTSLFWTISLGFDFRDYANKIWSIEGLNIETNSQCWGLSIVKTIPAAPSRVPTPPLPQFPPARPMLHEQLSITVDLRQVHRESACGDTETGFEQRRSGTFWEMYMNPALGNSSIFICVIDQLSTRSWGVFDFLIYNITKKRKIAKVNNSLNACGLSFFI